MYFLTFDTSLDKTYITLFQDKNCLKADIIENHDDKYHSAFLVQNLVNLLKSNNLTMKDIEAIGVNIGPGSFTGIRACLTIARVIAQQLEIPLIGIPSLEILARLNQSELNTTVIMDARKGMCYFAQYDKNGNCTKEPTLEVVDNLSLDIHTNKIITDAAMHNSLKERNIESICYTDINANLGKILGQLTYEKLKQNTTNHWAEAKPLYLQKPSITISKKNTLQ